MPPMPTAVEQQEQADAYRQSSKDLDTRVELGGHSAKELEMTFERFMASLYMTAMLQLGLMHEQGGQPHVDIIGARQTIDTLSLLAEKTKGNLTSAEEHFLQNCLYRTAHGVRRSDQCAGSASAGAGIGHRNQRTMKAILPVLRISVSEQLAEYLLLQRLRPRRPLKKHQGVAWEAAVRAWD